MENLIYSVNPAPNEILYLIGEIRRQYLQGILLEREYRTFETGLLECLKSTLNGSW